MFVLKIDMSSVEQLAKSTAARVDQIPFAMSFALNKEFATRGSLVKETWLANGSDLSLPKYQQQ